MENRMEAKSLSLFPPAIRLVGDLTVLGDARISCEIRGHIRVRGHLEIDPAAVVTGEVRSGSLHVEPGAVVKAGLSVGKAAAPVRGLSRFLPFLSR